VLTNRVLGAVPWGAADIVLRQGLQFMIMVILARMLTPQDFGVVALTALFSAVGTVFADGGFSAALIQRRELSEQDRSTAFWVNVSSGVLVAGILVLVSGQVADFYGVDALHRLLPLISLGVVFSSLGATHSSLLTKSLQLRTLTMAAAVSSIGAGTVAIVLASRGWGIWALAIQSVLAAALSTATLWVLSDWRPRARPRLKNARDMFGFGGYVFLANLSDVVYTRAYTVALGKFYSVADVGLYNRADATQQTATAVFSRIVSLLSLPAFSEVAHDRVHLRTWAKWSVRSVMLLNLPLLLVLSALSEPLVLTLFGERWAGAATVLRILLLAGALFPLHVINLNIMLAIGRSGLFLKAELIKKAVGLVLLVGGSFFGLLGIAASQIVFGVIAFAINSHFAGKLVGYGTVAQLRDCLPALGLAAPMSVAAAVVSANVNLGPVVELVAISAACALTYAGLARLLLPPAYGRPWQTAPLEMDGAT